jgi:hypothetical protein
MLLLNIASIKESHSTYLDEYAKLYAANWNGCAFYWPTPFGNRCPARPEVIPDAIREVESRYGGSIGSIRRRRRDSAIRRWREAYHNILFGGTLIRIVGDHRCDPKSEKYPLSVDVEQICAKLLAGVNFEQVHAELMAALEGIAAGKGHCDFIEVLPVGTTTKIFDALQRAVQFLCEPFESNATETAQKSARDHFFYFSGATPSAVRYQNWKMLLHVSHGWQHVQRRLGHKGVVHNILQSHCSDHIPRTRLCPTLTTSMPRPFPSLAWPSKQRLLCYFSH